MGHNESSPKRKVLSTESAFIKKLERSYSRDLTAHMKTPDQKEASLSKRIEVRK